MMDQKSLIKKLMQLPEALGNAAFPGYSSSPLQAVVSGQPEQAIPRLQAKINRDLQDTPENRENLQNSLNKVAVGAMLGGNDVSYAVPTAGKMTIEQMAEKAGGWKNPGDRARFDTAMLTNDTKTIKEMLPRVPEEYLVKNGFGPEIYRRLYDAAKGTITPRDVVQTTRAAGAGNFPDPTTRILSDKIDVPDLTQTVIDWFHR